MSVQVKCDNCNGNQEATHVVHHDNGDGSERYCDTCWITQGYSLLVLPCPNLKKDEDVESHSCSECEGRGDAKIVLTACCRAKEDWRDCDRLYSPGEYPQGEEDEYEGQVHEECYQTVCSKCGNLVSADCLPSVAD